MKAGQILRDAAALVEGDRHKTHGDKYENHQRIADYWNVFLGHRPEGQPLKAWEVAAMMALLKRARSTFGGYNPDDDLDGAAYDAIAGELRAIEERLAHPTPAPQPCPTARAINGAKPTFMYGQDVERLINPAGHQ